MTQLPQKLRELAKRRGFFFQSQESYGGAAGFYTYGPEGAAVKANIEEAWRDRFVSKESNMEIGAPTVMREPVFEASGHLDGFDDMIIDCPECKTSHRADHLIEDNTEIEEAESFSVEKAMNLIKENEIACPDCGASLSDSEVKDFNLMFETSIGPGSTNKGYLRPETAQGIFVEFPRLKQYARQKLPFGVTQIGRAYRNEISPRNALVRTREFTQAELEMFIDPERDEPDLSKVSDVELRLYSAEEQEKDSGNVRRMTISEAVDQDVIASDWVAYYLGIAKKWYKRIGIDKDRFRFRQHLPGERAHYAEDCWDAETDVGPEDEGDWLEIAGFAYRGCYDLKRHNELSEDSYTFFREFDEPREIEKTEVSVDMGALGPKYGSDAEKIAERLEELAREDSPRFDSGHVKIEVDGEDYEIDAELIEIRENTEEKTGEEFLPHVIEPSFGVDRTVYSVLIHSLSHDKIDGEDRTLLQLDAEISPVKVAVLPLMDKDGLGEKAEEVERMLRDEGFETRYDSSGSIGRRYRRQDEIGTPYAVTIDHDTLEDDKVTIRDRDSTEQDRVAIENLDEILQSKTKN